ncbi:transposase-like zinc-binding domain-containing protein [Pasteurella sp. PK-2025]|uniref:transposase-like zinc-binding domain-containing protein n=1 Tax=Pasteurella sp. PK-2025 TaxID=3413133 RepID=UPI003C738B64
MISKLPCLLTNHIFYRCNGQKNCPYCQNTVIHKHGLKNNIQRYKYHFLWVRVGCFRLK